MTKIKLIKEEKGSKSKVAADKTVVVECRDKGYGRGQKLGTRDEKGSN